MSGYTWATIDTLQAAKGAVMQRDIINPWQWQDQFGFVQANAVRDGQRGVYCYDLHRINACERARSPIWSSSACGGKLEQLLQGCLGFG